MIFLELVEYRKDLKFLVKKYRSLIENEDRERIRQYFT